jgi:FKBP-type peptidyl-prolyl cis-trans isomerase
MIAVLLALAAAAQGPPVPPPSPAVADPQARYLQRLDRDRRWHHTPSGLRYRKLHGRGRGPHPAPTDTVTIHYVGSLIDGTVFDSSIVRGTPDTFALPRLIPGWQEAVPLMTVGDRYQFAIPYTLAYGPDGRGPIPGGATLLFTIDLIAIAPPPAP